jgi:hypothetical protein
MGPNSYRVLETAGNGRGKVIGPSAEIVARGRSHMPSFSQQELGSLTAQKPDKFLASNTGVVISAQEVIYLPNRVPAGCIRD